MTTFFTAMYVHILQFIKKYLLKKVLKALEERPKSNEVEL